MEAPIAQAVSEQPQSPHPPPRDRTSSHRYRGANVEDLDPPPALSIPPTSAISTALFTAWERDYTHLVVLDTPSKQLLGYISIPHLKTLLANHAVRETDPVSKAMMRFQRRGRKFRVISMETSLEELEGFFDGEGEGSRDFAVVTDPGRRFVLGVATRGDLEEFVRRRPG